MSEQRAIEQKGWSSIFDTCAKASPAEPFICINHERHFLSGSELRFVILSQLSLENSLCLSLNNEHVLFPPFLLPLLFSLSLVKFHVSVPFLPGVEFHFTQLPCNSSFQVKERDLDPRGCSFFLLVAGVFLIRANPLRLAAFPP